MKALFRLLVSLLILPCFVGCITGGDERSSNTEFNTTVITAGSDTMAALMRSLSRQFMESHNSIGVSVIQSDSGASIAKLLTGGADIAASSRDLSDDEIGDAASHGHRLKKMMIARDAIAVIVNPTNPLTVMTIPDLRSIYLSEKKNWKDFGGSDQPIEVIVREPNSGTSQYFKDHVLEKHNYSMSDQVLHSQDEVIKLVEANHAAIGFVSMVESKRAGAKVKVIQLKLMKSSLKGVSPSQDTLVSDYPLGRPLYLIYVDDGAKASTKEFIDFCCSPVAQATIKQSGFVSIH